MILKDKILYHKTSKKSSLTHPKMNSSWGKISYIECYLMREKKQNRWLLAGM